MTAPDLRRQLAEKRAQIAVLRWRLFLSKLENAGLRIQRAAWRVFTLAGRS